jgi:hypothetical protein
MDHYEGVIYEADNAPGLFTRCFHFFVDSRRPYAGPDTDNTGALTERIITAEETVGINADFVCLLVACWI